MLAETKRCSVAKRLPPPWAGMPVSVPQPVRVSTARLSARAKKLKRFERAGCVPEREMGRKVDMTRGEIM